MQKKIKTPLKKLVTTSVTPNSVYDSHSSINNNSKSPQKESKFQVKKNHKINEAIFLIIGKVEKEEDDNKRNYNISCEIVCAYDIFFWPKDAQCLLL